MKYIIDTKPNIERRVAQKYAKLLLRQAVLGFATGNTMVGIYKELIPLLRSGNFISTTVNLDEQCFKSGPLNEDDERSFRSFMERHLFGPMRKINPNFSKDLNLFPSDEIVDIERVLPGLDLSSFDRTLSQMGGVTDWLLGIGKNCHLAFIEPSHLQGDQWFQRGSYSALLDLETREANKDYYGCNGDVNRVPDLAITVGPGTILNCINDCATLVAFGEGKANALHKALECDPSPETPASILQIFDAMPRKNVEIYMDLPAASKLQMMTRITN